MNLTAPQTPRNGTGSKGKQDVLETLASVQPHPVDKDFLFQLEMSLEVIDLDKLNIKPIKNKY